jgi:DNA-directed RNA polymerase subunit alpha
MSVKYGKFEMPQKISVDEETATPTYARLVAEPFERGFGHTVGSSMRRTVLSSLEAPAVISLRFEGVRHEYMAIEGIVEDTMNIILNVKGMLFRRPSTEEASSTRDPRIITTLLDVTQEDLDKRNGQYAVKFGDLVKDGYFEVVNPDLHLFTVTKPMKRQIDFRVALGRGYVPSERHVVRDKTVDEILIDASFSPVKLVNYYVENTRVGQDTDFDKLILEVTTDGRVSPVEAISFAAQIGIKHLDVFNKIKAHTLSFDEGLGEGQSDQDEIMEKLGLRIDEIELSVRSTNCLSSANIETIAELVSIPERRMLEFRNFGKKSLNEIKAKLSEMNMHLGMDLSRYGITSDNVKDKMRQYHETRNKRDRHRDKEGREGDREDDFGGDDE